MSAELAPNEDQARALVFLGQGHPTLLEGVAGTGKSFVVHRFLDSLPPERRARVAVTAATGIAATHLGGRTLHAWSGAGVGKWSARTIQFHNYWRESIAPDIAAMEIVIIDEISMVDAHIFQLASELCSIARNDLRPFGGLQVILVGDFGQLPPVDEQRGFAFESRAFHELGLKRVELTRVMRAADEWYIWLLRCIRDGHLPAQAEEILRQRIRAFDPEENGAVRLMTHNEQADRVNETKLAALPGAERVYKAVEAGDPQLLELIDDTCLSPRELKLRIGARVMFTRNHVFGDWVNGTLGVVESFEESIVWVRIDGADKPIPVARAEWKLDAPAAKGGKRYAARRQLPLRLAWAVTIHKSQGATLPLVSVDLGDVFAPGQAYVALSRARSLFGLNIERWGGRKCIRAHPLAVDFMRGRYTYKPRPKPTPREDEEYVL